jgi:hypothetical protein
MLKILKTIKYRNPKTGEFEALPAIKGDKGDKGNDGKKGDSIHVAYSSHDDGSYYTTYWQPGQIYLGIAVGSKQPSDKSYYTWIRLPEGPQGEQGTSANYSAEINYLTERLADLEIALRNGGFTPGVPDEPDEPDEPELPDEYCQINDFEGVDYDEDIGTYRTWVCECGTSVGYTDYISDNYYHYPPAPEVHKHTFNPHTGNEHKCSGCEVIEPHEFALLGSKNSTYHYRGLTCSICEYKKPESLAGSLYTKEPHAWVEDSNGKHCSVCGYEITVANICNINNFYEEVEINGDIYHRCECGALITTANMMSGILEHSAHEHDWVPNPDNENECICYGCSKTKEHGTGLWKFMEINSLYHKLGKQCPDCKAADFSAGGDPGYHLYSLDNGTRCICGREMESNHSHYFTPSNYEPDSRHACETCGYNESHSFNSGHDTFRCKCGYEMMCEAQSEDDYTRVDLYDPDDIGAQVYYKLVCNHCGYEINPVETENGYDYVNPKPTTHVKSSHVHVYNYNKTELLHFCACGSHAQHDFELDGIYRKCEVCGYYSEEVCPSLNFTYDYYSGYYKCVLCNQQFKDTSTLHYRPVTGLEPCTGTSYTPVTNGSGYKCTTCGAIVENRGDAHLPGDMPVDKICDHTVGTKTVNYSSIDEHGHKYDVVCANDKCGYKIAIATESHNYADGVCELCDHPCGHSDQGHTHLELESDDPQRDTYHVFITHCKICGHTLSEVHELHDMNGVICVSCSYNNCTHGDTSIDYINNVDDHIARTSCNVCGKVLDDYYENHTFNPHDAYFCVCGAQNCIHYNEDEGSFINVNIAPNDDGITHTYTAECDMCGAIVDTTVDYCSFNAGYCTTCGQSRPGSICKLNNFTEVFGNFFGDYQREYHCECGAIMSYDSYQKYLNGEMDHIVGR